jgi:glutaminyl-peptide cyclotransferase
VDKEGEAARWDRSIGQAKVPVYGYKVVKDYPHSTDSFTEGLVLNNGMLYEGTGLYKQSRLIKSELSTGQVVAERKLEPQYFGEGVTVLGDQLYQLTYVSNAGFVYDKNTLKQQKTFDLPTQGWGLTTDGKELIESNGSASLLFFDPDTMKLTHFVTVNDYQGEIGNVNELEYVSGVVYANIWQKDCIAMMSPKDGSITGWIDLTGLNPYGDSAQEEFVFNGIAYDPSSRHLVVTGKCWPKMFEIELVPPPGNDSIS